jgi:NADP-dependent 3-hydroxy acid dehydrogenase YdfG
MAARALVVGGTSGIGRKIASSLFSRGEEVVIAGRDLARAESVGNEIGKMVSGLALDLTRPKEIARAVRDLGQIDISCSRRWSVTATACELMTLSALCVP